MIIPMKIILITPSEISSLQFCMVNVTWHGISFVVKSDEFMT